MTTVTLPNALVAGQPENVNALNGNLNAIVNVVNGGLDNGNVAASAGIAYSKLNLAASLLTGDVGSVLADFLGVTVGGTTRRGFSRAVASIGVTSTSFVIDAGDTTVTATQPTNGITLVLFGVDASINPVGGPNQAEVGVQIDGSTNVTAASSASSTATALGLNANSFINQYALMARYLGGTHSWRLVYRATVGGLTATFANRELAVITLGF